MGAPHTAFHGVLIQSAQYGLASTSWILGYGLIQLNLISWDSFVSRAVAYSFNHYFGMLL